MTYLHFKELSSSILDIYKMTFTRKEAWKQCFTKVEKHQKDNNLPWRHKDG